MKEEVGLIERARELNRVLTGLQRRLIGELAVDHTERVGQRLEMVARRLGEPNYVFVVCAGYLHDVIEDTVNWENAEALERRRQQIADELHPEVLRIVEAVTVDQRLPYVTQFSTILHRARTVYRIQELLVKREDIKDNWETRQVYEGEYRTHWERFAREMLAEVVPGRLQALGWEE